jgi:hypothetical protein
LCVCGGCHRLLLGYSFFHKPALAMPIRLLAGGGGKRHGGKGRVEVGSRLGWITDEVGMRQGRSGHAVPRDPTEGTAVVESQQYVYASKGVCRAASSLTGDLAGGAGCWIDVRCSVQYAVWQY